MRHGFLVLVGWAGVVSGSAEKWTTRTGETCERRLRGFYGPLAIFGERDRSRQVPILRAVDAAMRPRTRPGGRP